MPTIPAVSRERTGGPEEGSRPLPPRLDPRAGRPSRGREATSAGAGGAGARRGTVLVRGLAGALSLAAVGPRVPRGRLLVASSFGFSALLLVFAFVRAAWLAVPLLLAIGFAMILNGAIANALLQAIVPDALRGRLMAAYSFVVVGMAQVVGAFCGGAVARAVGEGWAIGGGGALMLVYALWAFTRRPELARIGQPEPA